MLMLHGGRGVEMSLGGWRQRVSSAGFGKMALRGVLEPMRLQNIGSTRAQPSQGGVSGAERENCLMWR